jgi:glycosyltransferase involved in cell wall biosynthesis
MVTVSWNCCPREDVFSRGHDPLPNLSMPNPLAPSSATASRVPRQRLAFCITDLDPGGAEKALFQIVSRLIPADWECIVYCLGPEAELVQPLRAQGIQVECYGARSWRDWGVIFWLASRLREFRPSLLQCFLFHGNLVGRIAARLANVPIVLAGHRVAEGEKTWHLLLERLTRSLVDHHVCVSQGVAATISRKLKVPNSRISVIPNGVVTEIGSVPVNLLRDLGIPSGAPVVLGVGRLHRQKGFTKLISAFSQVAERFAAAHLLILGEGPLRKELEAQARDAGLESRVHLPGYRAHVPAVMRECSVLVLTSLWEGMPNVVLEAMSVGLPVIAAEVPGIAELIPDETHGIVVSDGAITGFAAALERILGDSRLAEQLSKNSQAYVNREFTWYSSVGEYGDLYRRLIESLTGNRKCD